jgi:hypothetical protein
VPVEGAAEPRGAVEGTSEDMGEKGGKRLGEYNTASWEVEQQRVGVIHQDLVVHHVGVVA